MTSGPALAFEPAHGTRARWLRHQQADERPCDACRAAHRDYENGRNRARMRPDEGFISPRVDAGPVRRHVAALRAAGMGTRAIAEAARLGRNAITQIASGETRRVARTTAEKVFAVNPRTDVADNAIVDGTRAWEQIDELLAAGWSKVGIAREVVAPRARSLQLRRGRILAKHARAVAELHAREFGKVRDNDVDRQRVLARELEDLYTAFAEVLEERAERSWRAHARCIGYSVDVFFPERGTSDGSEVRQLCARCPVQAECRAAAPASSEVGWYGGLSPKERRGLAAAS